MRPIARAALVALLAFPPAAGLAVGCGSGGEDTGSTSPTSGAVSTGTLSTGTAGTAGTAGTSGGGGDGGAGSTGSTGTATTGSTMAGGGVQEATCQGHTYECGDTIDNDGDNLVDANDPDCLGPCDNTEDSYYGGIPGQAGPACTVDCYFDNDSGSGNDDCHWNHKCDEHEVAPNFYPESENGDQCEYDPNANTSGTSATCDEMYVTQSQTCYDICGPLTPNGCDCFGCCELPAGGGNYVWLGSEDADGNGKCSLADVADPTKCEPCKPVQACLNGCAPCEVCVGKPEPGPECNPDGGSTSTGTSSGAGGGGGGQCAEGVQACGLPGQSPCPINYYCITGCCIPQPP